MIVISRLGVKLTEKQEKNNKVRFETIKPGEVFLCGRYYIKHRPTFSSNAVCLLDGSPGFFSESDSVIPVNGKFLEE